MFIVKKVEEKKNRFIIHYEIPTIPKIKLESIKPPKIQPSPKIKEKEKEQIKKAEKIEIREKNNNKIINKQPLTQKQIPHNLFCILHNQKQVTITPPKVSPPHLKKKRFIDDDTGNIIGRWSREEHKKFIEAIIKFGNNWKDVQEYVNSRTSTQARSHAQKFFEKIKKNNTLKFFDSLDSDYSENFTNATILQLHNKYGNKSKSEINSVVNKFLSLEYDLPKKKRKMINNNRNGILRKKYIGNKFNSNNNNNNIELNENEEYEYEEQEENENYKDNNNYENNENSRNNNIENANNYNNNIQNENNPQNYYQNNILQKPRIAEERNYYYNMYYNNNNLEYDYSHNGLNYIISQFVNNLSNEYTLDFNQNDPLIKYNKRKSTFESFGDESYFGQEGNLNYNGQNNFSSKYNAKSRKNSENSINRIIQNDKNDFKDYYLKKINLYDELNPIKPPFDNKNLKNGNIIEEFDNEIIKKY